MNIHRTQCFATALAIGVAALFVPSRAVESAPDASNPVGEAKPATVIPSNRNYEAHLSYQVYFDDYITLKRGHPADLIFIGDSITEQWRWGAGWPVWKQRFENRALDFGLGSDKTQDAIWRLENIDLSAWSPKVAVLLIGTNNFNDTPENIALGVKAVIAATQRKFSGIKIIVLSILPNARATEKMALANQLIAPLADNKSVFYLDLASHFVKEESNWKGLSPRDRLHLTEEGYTMWADALEPLVARLLGK